ncbi:MAG: hypothetical protein KJ941_02525 [Bacteroidetes bacterium]|nr:hypothetical protein [Bacteroidota bacterium]
MEVGNLITGAVFLLICIIPFVIMNYKQGKREDKMLQILNDNAQLQNCKLSTHEYCGDFILGYDERKNFVFFLKQIKENSLVQFVDLSQIQSCEAVKRTRTVVSNNENIVLTEGVDLSFIPKERSLGEIKFELFNDDINKQQSGELPFAEKWKKQLNERLKLENKIVQSEKLKSEPALTLAV